MAGKINDLLPMAQLGEVHAMAELSNLQSVLRAVDCEIQLLTTQQKMPSLPFSVAELQDAGLIANNAEKWQTWSSNQMDTLQKKRSELVLQQAQLRQGASIALGRRQAVERIIDEEKTKLSAKRNRRNYEL